MDRRTLAERIDHTVLGPETTFADVQRVLDEADEYGMNACIPPCYVAEELAAVVAAVPVPVKVIVEATLLDESELRRACEAAVDADADFVKTSTGFADGGARIEDVEVMSEYLPVKASGGVGNYEQAAAMFDAGAERIGASSGVAIVESFAE